jgi:integrase/recombinase XerD
MSEVVDRIVQSIQRGRTSWLKNAVKVFLEKLTSRQLKRGTLRIDASRLFRFGEFVAQSGVCSLAELPQTIEQFLQQCYPKQPSRGIWRSTLARFILHLREEGLIPVPESIPESPLPHVELVIGYLAYLREHRGLCEPYLRDIKNYCSTLLSHLDSEGITDLRISSAQSIHRFITVAAKDCARTTASRKCTVIRGFLAYLHRRELVPVDLSAVVISPKIYKHEQCPRFLTVTEVEAVLAAVKCRTARDRRNYAMMLLLAVYGLCGIEVRRLQLDDVDWKNQLIHIRNRKAGNSTTYPLTIGVAEAIVDYVRNDRPASEYRHVFLSSKPPFSPILTTRALGRLVQKFIRAAGITVYRPGTHTLRYSCAQRLLDAELSLKTIGDFLGHRDLGSTQRYTKIAISQLRDVAMNDGEDLL